MPTGKVEVGLASGAAERIADKMCPGQDGSALDLDRSTMFLRDIPVCAGTRASVAQTRASGTAGARNVFIVRGAPLDVGGFAAASCCEPKRFTLFQTLGEITGIFLAVEVFYFCSRRSDNRDKRADGENQSNAMHNCSSMVVVLPKKR
jgi:hypothetical protein